VTFTTAAAMSDTITATFSAQQHLLKFSRVNARPEPDVRWFSTVYHVKRLPNEPFEPRPHQKSGIKGKEGVRVTFSHLTAAAAMADGRADPPPWCCHPCMMASVVPVPHVRVAASLSFPPSVAEQCCGWICCRAARLPVAEFDVGQGELM